VNTAWVDRGTLAVAESDGHIVGFLFAAPYWNTRTGMVDYRTSLLYAVHVEPAFQRSGAGTAMVAAYKHDLEALQYRRAVAEVTPPGVALLERSGWTLASAAGPYEWVASGEDIGMPAAGRVTLAFEAWDDRALACLSLRAGRPGASFVAAAARRT